MKTSLLSIIFVLLSFTTFSQEEFKFTEYDSISGLHVAKFVELSPMFPGGEVEMMKYLSQNISLENIKLEEGTPTVFYIRFVIDKEGKVRGARAIKHPDHPIAKKCVQVVSEMPNWSPGKNKGQLVNVVFTLPIRIHPQ